MSRLGEELAKITEGLEGEPTGTSDAALEIKRIIKALDPDASTDGGTLENVIKIRELVEDGKGGESDVTLKTITFQNNYSSDINITGLIIDGMYGTISIPNNQTVSAQYVEPAIDAVAWVLYGDENLFNFVLNPPEGFEPQENMAYVDKNLQDGAIIIFSGGTGGEV